MTTAEPSDAPWTCPECHGESHADGCFLALVEDALAEDEDADWCAEGAGWEWKP